MPGVRFALFRAFRHENASFFSSPFQSTREIVSEDVKMLINFPKWNNCQVYDELIINRFIRESFAFFISKDSRKWWSQTRDKFPLKKAFWTIYHLNVIIMFKIYPISSKIINSL